MSGRCPFPSALVALVASIVAVRGQSSSYCNFTGGFAILEPSGCLTEQASCGNDGASLATRCCPSGSICFDDPYGEDSVYCCPTAEDCWDTLLETEQCPEPAWTLWEQNDSQINWWCCEADQYGVEILPATSNNNVSQITCLPVGETIDTVLSSTATSLLNPMSTSSCITASSAPSSSLPSTITSPLQSATATVSSADGTITTTVTGKGTDKLVTTTRVYTENSDSIATSTPAPAQTLQPAVHQLSTGAIAGIAVGAAAGVGLLLTGVLVLYRRRVHRRSLAASAAGGGYGAGAGAGGGGDHHAVAHTYKNNGPQPMMHEVSALNHPRDNFTKAELAASEIERVGCPGDGNGTGDLGHAITGGYALPPRRQAEDKSTTLVYEIGN